MNQREKIIAYFKELDRGYFLGIEDGLVGMDLPVPIGFGQTISQPTLVLNMTLALDITPQSRVLEIGTGSGYQTAMLAPFCEQVYTVERIEPLLQKAQERLQAKGFTNIQYKHGDGSLGWPEQQPYDRIIVTASAAEVPSELFDQLKPGGKMIIPVGEDLMQELQLIEKSKDGEMSISLLEKVAFVRLKGKYE